MSTGYCHLVNPKSELRPSSFPETKHLGRVPPLLCRRVLLIHNPWSSTPVGSQYNPEMHPFLVTSPNHSRKIFPPEHKPMHSINRNWLHKRLIISALNSNMSWPPIDPRPSFILPILGTAFTSLFSLTPSNPLVLYIFSFLYPQILSSLLLIWHMDKDQTFGNTIALCLGGAEVWPCLSYCCFPLSRTIFALTVINLVDSVPSPLSPPSHYSLLPSPFLGFCRWGDMAKRTQREGDFFSSHSNHTSRGDKGFIHHPHFLSNQRHTTTFYQNCFSTLLRTTSVSQMVCSMNIAQNLLIVLTVREQQSTLCTIPSSSKFFYLHPPPGILPASVSLLALWPTSSLKCESPGWLYLLQSLPG